MRVDVPIPPASSIVGGAVGSSGGWLGGAGAGGNAGAGVAADVAVGRGVAFAVGFETAVDIGVGGAGVGTADAVAVGVGTVAALGAGVENSIGGCSSNLTLGLTSNSLNRRSTRTSCLPTRFRNLKVICSDSPAATSMASLSSRESSTHKLAGNTASSALLFTMVAITLTS